MKLYFYHKENSPGVTHFTTQDQQQNTPYEIIYTKAGLHEIHITTQNSQKKYYRLMGETMLLHRDKFIVVYPHASPSSLVQLTHKNKNGLVTNIAPQAFENKMCIIPVPLIENQNSEPGILTIDILNDSNMTSLQRNIGYGGSHGGQQFLIDGIETELLA